MMITDPRRPLIIDLAQCRIGGAGGTLEPDSSVNSPSRPSQPAKPASKASQQSRPAERTGLARHPSRSSGTAAAASSTAAMRVGVKGSLSQVTAIRMAKTALVSRRAEAAAIGALLQTQRMSR